MVWPDELGYSVPCPSIATPPDTIASRAPAIASRIGRRRVDWNNHVPRPTPCTNATDNRMTLHIGTPLVRGLQTRATPGL